MRWIYRVLLVLLLLPIALLALLAILPERWLANTAERVATKVVGVNVSIDTVSIKVFSTTPGLALSGVSVSDGQQGRILEATDASVSIVASELLKANLLIQDLVLEGGPLSLVRFEDGSGNWSALLSETADDASNDALEELSLPAIDRIDIRNFQVQYDDRLSNRQADLSFRGTGSTTDADEPFLLGIQGNYNGLPVALDVAVRVPDGLAVELAEYGLVQWDLAAEVAATTLTMDGQLKELSGLRGLDTSLVFRAPDKTALEALVGVNMPELPALGFEGTVTKEGEEYLVRRYTGDFGDNRFRGDMRVDPTTQPITAIVNIDSEILDLDALSESAVETSEEAEAPAAKKGSETASLLSEDEFDLQPLTRLFNGAVRYTAQQVKSKSLPVESMDVRLEVKQQQIRLVPLDFGLGGGTLEAEVTLDVSDNGAEGVTELRLRGIDLQKVLATLGVDNASVGAIGGRAKYWIKGNSVASLARNADGGLFLLMTGGELVALLVELAGLDLMESIEELVDPDQDLTPIECGYLDLLTKSGVTEIERLVLGTEDTVFIGDGQFDANSKEFDLTVEPHPKDVSLLSARNSVTISGGPGDISITPGTELPARAAAIAVLAAIASPAAALLPLLESGGAADSEYCNGLLSSLDEAR